MKLNVRHCAIALSLILFGSCSFAAVTPTQTPLSVFSKSDYPIEDTVSKGLDPNILFLLDVGSAMTFTPWGIMPAEDKGTQAERALALKDCTYGVGGRPRIISAPYEDNELNKHGMYSRFGRELDESNNTIGDEDCYYTSDTVKPYLLTFQDRLLAHYTGWPTAPTFVPSGGNGSSSGKKITLGSTNLPNDGTSNTDSVLYNEKYYSPRALNVKKAMDAYTAIAGYMPGGSNEGNPVPLELANQYLVPNDSRMYKMKLVLWRLTSQPNAAMLSRMNLAMGTSYQETSGALFADFYKAAVVGAQEGNTGYYGATSTFKYGNAPSWSSGTGNNGTSAGQNYYMSQRIYAGVLRDYYDYGVDSAEWRQVNRSILAVPFNKIYKMNPSTGVYEADANKINNFRKYINGIESASEPELVADGKTPLATSLYARDEYHIGKNDSKGQYLIQYAPKSIKYGSGNLVLGGIERNNIDNLTSGQAAGSIVDFFSPRSVSSGRSDGLGFVYNATDTTKDTSGFFPVTGSCQQNWLIVFTAANDSDADYDAAEAAKKLFDNTLAMRGRKWVANKNDSKQGSWAETTYAMNSGVRTLVVGFVSPTADDENSKQLREDLTKIAQYGDPVLSGDMDPSNPSDWFPNPHAVPYFANNVPELIKAFETVMKRIQVDRMGSGTPVSLPPLNDEYESGARVIFSASLKMNNFDQWQAWLSKSKVLGDGTTSEVWEADSQMRARGKNRKLYVIKENAPSKIADVYELPSGSLAPATTRLIFNLPSAVADASVNSFKDWLFAFGNSGDTQIGVLGDMIHSGITVVGKPKADDLKADSNVMNRDSSIYVQTNRGMLHAIDYDTGSERWAFIPPNISQTKTRYLKFTTATVANNVTWTWINGNGLTSMRSNPMVLLDGMLVAKDVRLLDNFSQPKFKTFLVGHLGYGGNGLYAMDITNSSATATESPNFLWAIENARQGGGIGSANVKLWGKAFDSMEDYSYNDLGLTIAHSVLITPQGEADKEVGVLPGGLGYNFGTDSHGKVFYFYKPTNGSIIKKIDTSSVSDFLAPAGVSLGMGIAPVVYQDNSEKKTTSFYSSDSNGNMLYCDTTQALSQWKLRSLFRLTTVRTPDLKGNTVSEGQPVVTPGALVYASSAAGLEWVFGGTSDLLGPSSGGERWIINKQQFIYGLNVKNLKSNAAATAITTSHSDMKETVYYDDGIVPKYSAIAYKYSSSTPNMDGYGWYLRLRPAISGTDLERGTLPEYVSADPYLFNGVLYVATFITREKSNSDETCVQIGTAKLYILNPLTGESLLPTHPAINMDNIKISGITGLGSRITLAVKELQPGGLDAVTNSGSLKNSKIIGDGGVLDFEDFGTARELPDNLDPNKPYIQYWREKFR